MSSAGDTPRHSWPPKLSADLYDIQVDESNYIFYAPLRRSAFAGNAGMRRFLENLRNNRYDSDADPDGSLIDFLRQLEIVDGGPEPVPSNVPTGDPEPVSVTLFLTTACNLRCTYCYASAGTAPVARMNLETAQRGIDFVSANASRKNVPYIEVGYHGGGEPTLNWDVLTASHAYAREKAAQLGIELRSSLATNGVLGRGRLEWIVKNLSGVSLSCDGTPSVHDRNRPGASGKGSSGWVVRTMQTFAAADFKFGVRLTVTGDDIVSLPESIDFLCDFHPQAIQVEPVYRMGRGSGAASAETEAFVAAYREAAGCASARGVEMRFSAVRVGSVTNSFCQVSRDNFCLSTDGSVTACFEAFAQDVPWAEKFFYGRPWTDGPGYEFDPAVVASLRSQVVQSRTGCASCFAKWTCAGDCYYKLLVATDGDIEQGSARCYVIRELTKDQILKRISDSGGLFWRDPVPARLGGGGGC